MSKYVFLRLNEKFKDFFRGNKDAFLELYYRREESVFYKEQFRVFLDKINSKELTNYLVRSMGIRDDMKVLSNRIIIDNKYENNKDILEAHDNYLLVDTEGKNNPFKRYLLDYDSDFIIIDLNNSKIETCYL